MIGRRLRFLGQRERLRLARAADAGSQRDNQNVTPSAGVAIHDRGVSQFETA